MEKKARMCQIHSCFYYAHRKNASLLPFGPPIVSIQKQSQSHGERLLPDLGTYTVDRRPQTRQAEVEMVATEDAPI